MNYIETYINPVIDEYIANHPSKDKIDDTLDKNDAQYHQQLTSTESLLLTSNQSQSSAPIIFAILIFALSYLSWIFINRLLSSSFRS